VIGRFTCRSGLGQRHPHAERSTGYARTTWRTRLIDVLRHIANRRSDSGLLDGLDPHDSTVVRTILDRLAPWHPG
jgi:hypothetical protein